MFKLIIVFSGFIVTCAAKYGNISLIDFDLPCSLENGAKGEYALLTNCPEILKAVKLGATFPKVCDVNEVCWDVVCCNGSTKYGSLPDLNRRLKSEIETCSIEGTEIEGIYRPQKYCPSLIDKSISRDPICPFTFCENIVCCPHNTTDVMEISGKVDYFEETCIFDKPFDYNLAYEGDSCVISIRADGGKRYGYCKPYFKCDDYTNSYDFESNKFSENVTLCGYNCCVPMVCCPTSYLGSYYVLPKYKHLPRTLARSACLKANPHIENYDIIDSKHIDNIRTSNCKDNSSILESKNQLYLKQIGRKYSVDLGYMPLESPDFIWDCEGVMLTLTTVLTTASCLESSKNGPVLSVRLGENRYEVKKIIKHPQYKAPLFYHDIGLAMTKEEFKLESNCNLACLPETRNVLNEEQLIAGNSDSIEKSVIKIVGAIYCKATINGLKQEQLKYGFIEDVQFCADLVDSTDHCPLKMVGSPLVTQSGVVVGLNLVVRKCEKEQPGSLFESTYPYVRWIETFLKLSN